MGTATGIIRALNSGIKHIATKRFTLRYQGLDQRLTGVEPMKVLKKILA